MRLMYAFLADAAQLTPDAKLQVMGGDFDTLYAESLPFVQPLLSLVLKIRLYPEELDQDHGLRVDVWKPDGEMLGKPLILHVTAPRDTGRPAQPFNAATVLNLPFVRFEVPGEYTLRVWWDEQEVTQLPLNVVQRGEKEGSE